MGGSGPDGMEGWRRRHALVSNEITGGMRGTVRLETLTSETRTKSSSPVLAYPRSPCRVDQGDGGGNGAEGESEGRFCRCVPFIYQWVGLS